MTPQILDWLQRTRARVPVPGRVLEVGSFDVNGSPRTHYQADATEYVGIDAQPGPGVDLVCPAHALPFTDPFDTIICCEMLEHDPQPLATIAEMHRLLRAGGHLIVTSPANGFPLHSYPRDYWRLMPDAYEDLVFRGMRILDRHLTGDPCHCYLGRKG